MIDRTIRRLRRVLREAYLTSGVPSRIDHARIVRTARAGRRADAPADGEHVLLAAPGGGNIGDQAMFEAFLEGTGGPVAVIVRSASEVAVPDAHAGRVRVLELPDLVYGARGAHAADVARFGELLRTAASLSVVGADIMDGRYVLRPSVRRSALAGAAAAAGVDSRILGFSWNGQARVAARRALVKASRHGAVPMLRDPISAERAARDGVVGISEVADIVFSATTSDRSLLDGLGELGRPFAIVNVSGLIGGQVDQGAEYVRIIRHLVDRGLEVVVLPHVSRPDADDLAACEAVVARLDGTPVRFIRTLGTPASIRGLADGASVVVTGRMHLAIMSIWSGKPAITLATQGKVEGLMRLLGTPALCVEPKAGFGEEVVRVIDEVLPDDSPVRSAIAAALPHVKDLARLNLAGLAPAADAVAVTDGDAVDVAVA
ncbi:polysaccharide pyruvyl transferase family protein [Agromyces salentinus]|uniref:Polysaccharide pyruvyl transferase domain-containing protein n=1 Tax=Agromyces salentinus TaxID=269421 RepID=A0ABN2MTL3_9MICO|nr:polysaccharide pyruvyl transferase family protein [Agromyces salentinus]